MNVLTQQQRIAELAKQSPEMSFYSLSQHMDVDWLREAYGKLKKSSSPGTDGVTVEAYGQNLNENLNTLLDRAKSGRYIAPPVRRAHLPKPDAPTETRPIGVPTTEDKVLQRAVAMLLEPIYEEDYLGCSYGFRPGRSPHQALDDLWRSVMGKGGGWVLEVDIRKFFDTLDRAHLRRLLQKRVRDGVILRLIGKWLNAGVLEEDQLSHPERGTPQGGVISPLLSNIYLHYVLDLWFEHEVKPRLVGRAVLIRFADDFVIVFQSKSDAERVLGVLPKRFAKYGLSIHPDKTRLVRFAPSRNGATKPGTFDFLAFTHYWGKSRRGHWVVKRKTAKSRLRRAMIATWQWCRKSRHRPLREQHAALCRKLRGHYGYYGITGNHRSLTLYWHRVRQAWHYWLNRRNRENRMPWGRFLGLLTYYPLPTPRVVHSAYAAKP
jgi:group II intron reverse transcriptase/maturase